MNCLNLIKDLKNIPLYYRSMDLKSFIWFVKAAILVRRCILYLNAEFRNIDKKTIVSLKQYGGISFYVKSVSDLFVILEVFFKLCTKYIVTLNQFLLT
jgi:hypothetical protein